MNYFQLVIFFLIIAFQHLQSAKPDELFTKIEAHHRECRKISKVDPKILTNARNGQFDQSSSALKDHIFCYSKRVGFINQSGQFLRNIARQKLLEQMTDQAGVDKIIQTCDEVMSKGDRKLYALQLVACYSKNIPSGVIIL